MAYVLLGVLVESIAVALIGGSVVAPIGAIASNPRSRAAIELKINELTSSEPTNSSRKWPWSGATLTHFCDEPERGLAIAACIPVLLAAVLSRQTIVHSDC